MMIISTIPSILVFIESAVVSVLLGASTLAVISYAISLRHGYPREGVGNHLIQSIYTLIRLFHVFFMIIVMIVVIVYGLLDGIHEVQIEYGVKAAILLINGFIALGMAKRLLPVRYAAPSIAAGWYFLGSYEIYTASYALLSITTPVIWYLSLIIFFQLVFVLLHHFIKPAENSGT